MVFTAVVASLRVTQPTWLCSLVSLAFVEAAL